MLRALALLYFKQDRLRQVCTISTCVEHQVLVVLCASRKAGGTVGTPPQVPPQALRRQARRLGRVGSRMMRVGRPDNEVADVDDSGTGQSV
jgi:hypothetical protein